MLQLREAKLRLSVNIPLIKHSIVAHQILRVRSISLPAHAGGGPPCIQHVKLSLVCPTKALKTTHTFSLRSQNLYSYTHLSVFNHSTSVWSLFVKSAVRTPMLACDWSDAVSYTLPVSMQGSPGLVSCWPLNLTGNFRVDELALPASLSSTGLCRATGEPMWSVLLTPSGQTQEVHF